MLGAGEYRATVVRRQYLPKADGGQRPLDGGAAGVGADIRGGLSAVLVWLSAEPRDSGLGQHFRTGNADTRFIRIDPYIRRRLLSLCIARKGRNLQAGAVSRWTREYFESLGLYRLRGTVRYLQSSFFWEPFGSCVMLPLNGSMISRVREIRMQGLVWGPDSYYCLWPI